MTTSSRIWLYRELLHSRALRVFWLVGTGTASGAPANGSATAECIRVSGGARCSRLDRAHSSDENASPLTEAMGAPDADVMVTDSGQSPSSQMVCTGVRHTPATS